MKIFFIGKCVVIQRVDMEDVICMSGGEELLLLLVKMDK